MFQATLEDSPQRLDQHGPLFIVGCPRSGTTFLADCFGAEAAVEMFVGVLAPPRLMHMIGYAAQQKQNSEPLLRVIRDIFWQSFWRRRSMRSERIQQLIRYRKGLSYWQSPLESGHSLFCYKEPFAIFAMAQLAQHFVCSKFIHIIRDGRDVADSLLRTYPNVLSDDILQDVALAEMHHSEIGPYSLMNGWIVPWWVAEDRQADFIAASQYGRAVWLWREMVFRGRSLGQQLGPQRYLEIRYEQLMQGSEQQAQQLAAFAGLTSAGRLAKQFKQRHARSIGVARRQQLPHKLTEAERLIGELLKELDY